MDNRFAFLGTTLRGVADSQQHAQGRHYDNATKAFQNNLQVVQAKDCAYVWIESLHYDGWKLITLLVINHRALTAPRMQYGSSIDG